MKKKQAMVSGRVWTPPTTAFELAPSPRLQTLPLLYWEDFERLCARLAQRSDHVEFSQKYGVPGQDQEGIDIYVRMRGADSYALWQCKRYQLATPALIRGAVDEFVAGQWATKCQEFILAITAEISEKSLADEIEFQAKRLAEQEITFTPIGITQISERLKNHPDLVDDFFGREAVVKFCGEEAVKSLPPRRLSLEKVARLRTLLRNCYEHHFESVDPGLPSMKAGISTGPNPLKLSSRFILPDVIETRDIQPGATPSPIQPQSENSSPTDASSASKEKEGRPRELSVQVRKPVLEWLGQGDYFIILGEPGMGKSSLLRYLLLDLLSEDPRHEKLAMKWGNRLPVWIPFALWTRMVGESEDRCSLAHVLEVWLSKVSPDPDFKTLIRESLDDSRLLLFVDGLDEWSDESAAGTAVAMLEQFIGERNIPAIASGRPLGFKRLGGLSGKWTKASLGGLTADQQEAFSRHWFLHRGDGHEGDAAHTEAQAFIKELHGESRLATLGENPLLLSGLIALAMQKLHLPRSRFKAYEDLTKLLVQEQPKRRDKAAYARQSMPGPNPETRLRALAMLAHEIHSSPGSDSIERMTARSILERFIRDHLKRSDADALEIAESLLGSCTDSIGILVEKSPNEIGFPHRVFQEFLAASHLKNQPFSDQKKAFEQLFRSPQWHDILLCLCHLTTRNDEVDTFVGIAEGAILQLEEESARKMFLAEVAFNDLNASTSTAIRLAEITFNEIETGFSPSARHQLLDHALNGLYSDSLRGILSTRIQNWYPNRFKSKEGLYKAMESWPADTTTCRILWHGILNEDSDSQRAAAETFAKVFMGNNDMSERLLEVLSRPYSPSTLAHFIHALCLGWPGNNAIGPLLERAKASTDDLLAVVAAHHRALRNEQDDDDKNTFMWVLSGRSSLDREWKRDAIRSLLRRWPSDELKREAMKVAAERYGDADHKIDRSEAWELLLEGFPQDDEVAEIICEIFRNEEHPLHCFGIFHDWPSLTQAFGGHRLVTVAVDEWIGKKNPADPAIDYRFCQFSKSVVARTALIQPANGTGVINAYQARWLFAEWGMNDSVAAEALLKLAESPQRTTIIDLLPFVLKDKQEARKLFIDHLRTEEDVYGYYLLQSAIKMATDSNDTEIINICLEKLANQVPNGIMYTGIGSLIEAFPKYPGVRALALHQIRNRGGAVGAVARAYADDSEIRIEMASHVTALPNSLRLSLLDKVAPTSAEDDFVHRLLAVFDEDRDVNVKVAGASAFARSALSRAEPIEELTAKLTALTHAVGPDYSERRSAALAGLLEIRRLDIIQQQQTSGDKILGLIDLGGIITLNFRTASQIAKNWPYVKEVFGEEFLTNIGHLSEGFLKEITLNTTDEDLIEAVVKASEGQPPSQMGTALALQIRARQWRGTDRLKDRCLKATLASKHADWLYVSVCMLAAEVLGEQFGGNTDILATLEAGFQSLRDCSALAIALCVGWSESELLRKIEVPTWDKLYTPAQVHLISRFWEASKFVEWTGKSLPRLGDSIWHFLPISTRAIERRLKNDMECREIALQCLQPDKTSEELGCLPQLLHRTGYGGSHLQDWAKAEYRRQFVKGRLPGNLFDVATGRQRPVADLMLEIMSR